MEKKRKKESVGGMYRRKHVFCSMSLDNFGREIQSPLGVTARTIPWDGVRVCYREWLQSSLVIGEGSASHFSTLKQHVFLCWLHSSSQFSVAKVLLRFFLFLDKYWHYFFLCIHCSLSVVCKDLRVLDTLSRNLRAQN